MTSPTETTNLDAELLDLQKQLGEEKRTHSETIFRYLSAQTQAQTAEAKAAKAQELVTETTLKLDQAREEIMGLRAQTQEAQNQAQEAQAKIEDLEAQMTQMKLSEQSQAQTAIEAQEEIRNLRAQAQEAQTKIKDLEARIAQMKVVEQSQIATEAQAQELRTAKDKIASLEARMIKVRAAVAESEVDTNPAQTQAQELQAKIDNLEVQMAQMKVVEQFQVQTQELRAAQAQVRDLESQVTQTQEEVRSLRAQTEAQTQELKAAQEKIEDLEAKVQSKPKAPVQVPTRTDRGQPRDLSWLENSYYLDAYSLNWKTAPWFGPDHLKHYAGQKLRLCEYNLRAEDIVQFLDSWLAGTHPYLEMLILDDLRFHPTTFDKFAPSLVRHYDGGSWYSSKTFHLERPSDGRIACVKITWDNMFVFIV